MLKYLFSTCQFPIGVWPDQSEPSIPPPPICTLLKKCIQNFRDITWNEEENEILHEIFRVISRFSRYISCSIAEIWITFGTVKRQQSGRPGALLVSLYLSISLCLVCLKMAGLPARGAREIARIGLLVAWTARLLTWIHQPKKWWAETFG